MSVDNDRLAHPDGLKNIREVLEGGLICTTCEAHLEQRHYRPVNSNRILCWTCAKEIVYGIVPPGLPLQSYGGRRTLEDEDANGCRSNAMRALEDV